MSNHPDAIVICCEACGERHTAAFSHYRPGPAPNYQPDKAHPVYESACPVDGIADYWTRAADVSRLNPEATR